MTAPNGTAALHRDPGAAPDDTAAVPHDPGAVRDEVDATPNHTGAPEPSTSATPRWRLAVATLLVGLWTAVLLLGADVRPAHPGAPREIRSGRPRAAGPVVVGPARLMALSSRAAPPGGGPRGSTGSPAASDVAGGGRAGPRPLRSPSLAALCRRFLAALGEWEARRQHARALRRLRALSTPALAAELAATRRRSPPATRPTATSLRSVKVFREPGGATAVVELRVGLFRRALALRVTNTPAGPRIAALEP